MVLIADVQVLLETGLVLFVGHKLFFLEVIEEPITKTNLVVNQFRVLSFIALKELEKDGHLVERYTYLKGKGIQNLCVIVNVGRNKLSETYLSTSWVVTIGRVS